MAMACGSSRQSNKSNSTLPSIITAAKHHPASFEQGSRPQRTKPGPFEFSTLVVCSNLEVCNRCKRNRKDLHERISRYLGQFQRRPESRNPNRDGCGTTRWRLLGSGETLHRARRLPGCCADPQSPDDCSSDVAVSTRASAAETLQPSLETKLRHCHGPWSPGSSGRGFRAVHPAGRRNQHPSPFVAVPALETMDAD